jgi:hypothetical protein
VTGAGTPIGDAIIKAASVVETISDSDKREIERLRSGHPDYNAKKLTWGFFAKAYEGGSAYSCEDTLHRHVREQELDYKDRLKRSHGYRNYCAPLVDFVPEFVYSHPISREPVNALKVDFETFIKDVDQCGTDITTFMRELSEEVRIFGRMTVGMDKPAVPDGTDTSTMSKADEERLGLNKLYWVRCTPLEILDWAFDARGRYSYIKRLEIKRTVDQSTFETRVIERYYEWSTTTIRVSDIDVTDPDKPKLAKQPPKPNPFRLVPFRTVSYKRSKTQKGSSISFLEDIAYLNNDVFNLNSLGKEFMYKQCFNILIKEQDTAMPTASASDQSVGSANAIEVPPNAKFPQYLAPDVAPAEHIAKETAVTVLEMYRIAAQDVLSELFGTPRSASGDAGKQSFHSRSVPAIAKQADIMQAFEVELFTMWAILLQNDWQNGKIGYKDDYSITTLLDLITQLTQIFRSILLPSPTFVKSEWKRLVREMDGSIPHETLGKILQEIDDYPDEKILPMYQAAGPMGAAPGVPSTANAIQGKTQEGKSDEQIGGLTGNKAPTKEQAPDANKRVTS